LEAERLEEEKIKLKSLQRALDAQLRVNDFIFDFFIVIALLILNSDFFFFVKSNLKLGKAIFKYKLLNTIEVCCLCKSSSNSNSISSISINSK